MSNVNELNLPDPTSSSNSNSLQTPTSSSAQLHSHFNHQTNNYRQTRHHSISSTPSSTTAIPHRLTTSNLHQSRIKRNHRSNSISSNTSTNSSTSTLPTTINRSNRRMSPFTDKAGLPSPCFVHSHLDSNLYDDDDGELTEGEEHESLTRQLAQTATSVREMSKTLARARIKGNVQSILIITKARDNHLIKLTRELAIWLMDSKPFTSLSAPNPEDTQLERKPLVVYVDSQLKRSKRFDLNSIKTEYPQFFNPLRSRHPFQDGGQLRYWTAEMCNKSPELFDFVITLGGDGTVLFASWLFQKVVPPIVPFALGSLGFLTNFDYSHYPTVLTQAMRHGVRVNLRMRFNCTVYRANDQNRRAIKSESFEVLNELVVDRGPSPYVSLLELFGDDHHMTTVQADGLTVSTPTGSTAYSLSAGGSLVHPEVPALLITPICPHTLSFRPMLLPESIDLRICVPYSSRSTAWASFDGRGRIELRQGDHIKVTASAYPFPTVCADNQSTDWFHAISRTLKWNERERQKSF
ncbi:ATP-NAD kinase-like domain-containing protein, partial [Melampsora americana]